MLAQGYRGVFTRPKLWSVDPWWGDTTTRVMCSGVKVASSPYVVIGQTGAPTQSYVNNYDANLVIVYSIIPRGLLSRVSNEFNGVSEGILM